MPESRFPPIALLLVLIAVSAIYGIILWPDVTFAGMDFVNLNYPRVALGRESLAAGHIPLWNWHEWGGAPLLAALQGAVFYPPTWAAMVLPLPYGLQVFVFAHLAAAGIGAFLVARRIFRMSPMPASYVGIAYVGNAFFTGRIEQFQIVAVNCMLPFLLLCLWNAVFRRRGSRWVAVVWAAHLLAGHPQFAILNFLGAAVFMGMAALLTRRRRVPLIQHSLTVGRRGLRVCGQLLLGSALAALQLLPTWELSKLSERIWPYPQPTQPELSWANLPALLIPNYYNIITDEPGRVLGFTELGIYAGVLTVPLAIAAGVWLIRSHRRRGRGLRTGNLVTAAGVTWFLSMWFALGTQGGVAEFIFDKAPFFTQTRGAARSLNVAGLMLALLAGQGVYWLSNRLHEKIRKDGSRGKGDEVLAIGRRTSHGVWSKSTVAGILICLITTADLSYHHHSVLKSVLTPEATVRAKPLVPGPIAEEVRATKSPIYRFMAFDSDIHLNNSPASVSERFARLQPNLGSVTGFNLLDGYEEGLLPTRNYANLLRRFNRNLRGPSPDAALLAGMGSNIMLTEYPLSPNAAEWSAASAAYLRPPVVPSMNPPQQGAYWWWKSNYPALRWADLDKLVPAGISLKQFLHDMSAEFPLTSVDRAPASSEAFRHSLSGISAQQFLDAGGEDGSIMENWNSLSILVDSSVDQVGVLLRPYPGWRLSEKNSSDAKIKPLNALWYMIENQKAKSMSHGLELKFSPFSFHLGLFVSLIAASILIFQCFSTMCRQNRRNIRNQRVE